MRIARLLELRRAKFASATASVAVMSLAGTALMRPATAGEVGARRVGYAPQIFVAKRDGGVHRLTRGEPGYVVPAWRPDGRQIATGHAFDIDVLARRDGGLVRHFEGGPDGTSAPVWGPDGKRVAYIAYAGHNGRLFVGSVAKDQRHEITDKAGGGLDWSADGQRLYYLHGPQPRPFENQRLRSIYSIDPRGRDERKVLSNVSTLGGLSSDGRWLAYTRRGGVGLSEVWVARSDGSEQRLLEKRSNSFTFGWAPGHRGIYILDADPTHHQRPLVISTSGKRHRLGARIATRAFAWSADGTRIAWAREARVTDVKTSRPDGTDVRTLARFAATGGVEVGALTWTRDGSYLAIEPYRHSGD